MKIIELINDWLWTYLMVGVLLGTALYFTIRSRGVQFSMIPEMLRLLFESGKSHNNPNIHDKLGHTISSFQAFTLSLASRVGTGNIAGVAIAIVLGGPGAVFWMWLSAFFGMMTNYSENVLGIFYRKKNDHGEWSGGAMYYINEGLKDRKGFKHIAKPLAVLFSIFCVLASFGIGNMTQVNSISSAMKSNFNIPTVVTGIVLAVIAALVIVGGIEAYRKRYRKACAVYGSVLYNRLPDNFLFQLSPDTLCVFKHFQQCL